MNLRKDHYRLARLYRLALVPVNPLSGLGRLLEPSVLGASTRLSKLATSTAMDGFDLMSAVVGGDGPRFLEVPYPFRRLVGGSWDVYNGSKSSRLDPGLRSPPCRESGGQCRSYPSSSRRRSPDASLRILT